ncbi:hypothetical protein PFISCL1PPCAC_8197, partial [Pristionchus fissidentatus]
LQMSSRHRISEDQRGEDVEKYVRMLKMYESTNTNDISALLSGMANVLNALYHNKPVQELNTQLWALQGQLRNVPYDVNEHSKAIEALASLFAHSIEVVVEKEEKMKEKDKRKIGRKSATFKETEFVPSQSHHTPSSYETPSQPQYPAETPTRPLSSIQYQPYEETWESTMDINEFDLNQPLPSTMDAQGDWDEDVSEMPLLEEEEEEEGRYSRGLRRGTGGAERIERKKEEDVRVEGRYGGGLRGKINTPITPSKGFGDGGSEQRFVPVSQRRVMVTKQHVQQHRPVKIAIVRRGISTSPSKISLKKTPVAKPEGSAIGMGKPNVARENYLLSRICPQSVNAQKSGGVDNQGTSFISRSRARISGLIREERRDSPRLMEPKKDEVSLEESVIESRKRVKEDLHDGRKTRDPTEATFNTNLSETWWALESRLGGPSLLSQRMKRLSEKKNDGTSK